jgi:hypothetical protein
MVFAAAFTSGIQKILDRAENESAGLKCMILMCSTPAILLLCVLSCVGMAFDIAVSLAVNLILTMISIVPLLATFSMYDSRHVLRWLAQFNSYWWDVKIDSDTVASDTVIGRLGVAPLIQLKVLYSLGHHPITMIGVLPSMVILFALLIAMTTIDIAVTMIVCAVYLVPLVAVSSLMVFAMCFDFPIAMLKGVTGSLASTINKYWKHEKAIDRAMTMSSMA